MRFAFLVHPLSAESASLLRLNERGRLHTQWGQDVLGFGRQLHRMLRAAKDQPANLPSGPRPVDQLTGLVSAAGATTEGRLYEIPLDARGILADPGAAVRLMEQAMDQAAEWGAGIVGLGSMTGVVGGQGAHLAERGPVKVTTGNCLTVYAALENLRHACEECGLDLAHQSVAVIGVPGSIATALARRLAAQCHRLLLVGRQVSRRAAQLAHDLGAELLTDIPAALARSRVILSATSAGDCIDQRLLLPGSLVLDVAVPTDVQGGQALRDDVLILTGGLARVPDTFARDSMFLRFFQGMVPSCLGETMVLALEKRAECFSVGRDLDLDRVLEIGGLAERHGFDFSQLQSFGQPLEPGTVARFLKARARIAGVGHANGSLNGSAASKKPAGDDLVGAAQRRYTRYLNPVAAGMTGPEGLLTTFVRGQGTELFDAEGRAYLDFVAGFGSVNLGHNHPAVVHALTTALAKQAPGFAPGSVNPWAAALAEQLVSVAPPGLEIVFFCNSGAESIEAALKLARAVTGRSALLSCENGYHGKTLGALSVTPREAYQRPFAPLVPLCETVPFDDLEALERALASRRFAAFIVEPLQGEGGMRVPGPGYLRTAQDLCRAAGTLLIADEVQTGLGRTGDLFACDHDGVEPDVLALAKSLGGGLMPLGAMLTRRDLWQRAYGSLQTFALHTSTFGGGSLACAAGLETLRVLRDEHLVANAQSRSQQLLDGLALLARECPLVADVRGRGLMLGIELRPMPASILQHFKGMGAAGAAAWLVPNRDEWVRSLSGVYVMQTLLHTHRIHTQVTRSNPLVLRVQPPLTITAAEVDRFLEALSETCRELAFARRITDSILSRSIGALETAAPAAALTPHHPEPTH
jgi:putrescine aminotransferase